MEEDDNYFRAEVYEHMTIKEVAQSYERRAATPRDRTMTILSQLSSSPDNPIDDGDDELRLDTRSEVRPWRLLFAMLNNNECDELRSLLEETKDSMDVTQVLDSRGFSPVLLAAYKSQINSCEILIDFVLHKQEISLSRETGGTGIMNEVDQKKQ